MSNMEQKYSKAYHSYLAVFFSLLTMSSFCKAFKLKGYTFRESNSTSFIFASSVGGQLLKEFLPSQGGGGGGRAGGRRR